MYSLDYSELTGEYPLQKCPDRNAKISFTIRVLLKEEIKSLHNLSNLGKGLMPDMMMGIKPQQVNQPTNDGFKKKVKINDHQELLSPVSTPQFGQHQPIQAEPQHQPQYSDHYKNEREALIS